jgi:hypothetical protein
LKIFKAAAAAAAAAAVVAVAEVLVIAAQNQAISHAIALNLIHAVDKAVVQETNKAEMMMKIR